MTNPTGISPAAALAPAPRGKICFLTLSLLGRGRQLSRFMGVSLLSSEKKLILYLLSETQSLKTSCQPVCTSQSFRAMPTSPGSTCSDLCEPVSCTQPESSTQCASPPSCQEPQTLPRKLPWTLSLPLHPRPAMTSPAAATSPSSRLQLPGLVFPPAHLPSQPPSIC